MSLLRNLLPSSAPETRFTGNLNDLLQWFNYNGNTYQVLNQTLSGNEETVDHNFVGYVTQAYKNGGVVAACMVARRHVFAQIPWKWQSFNNGRPGDLFGAQDLSVLERPWPGGTTSDLNARMLDHADLAGNAYVTNKTSSGNLKLLRPDYVKILIGNRELAPKDWDPNDINNELIGYAYMPPGKRPTRLDPLDVAHFAPEPDPLYTYKGMSWLTPIIRNTLSHSAATDHKKRFFTNGATPNMVLSWDANVTVEKLKEFAELFQEEHAGVANAYKTMFLGGGANATVVGQDFKQLDFKTVQGTDETLIAAAAGVPPIIAGLSEGLAASTYSNYGQAKRQFADTTIAHLGQNAAASLEVVTGQRAGARLWYDLRDIPFFRDDAKAEADVLQKETTMIRTLIDGGYTPDSVTVAVQAGDWSLLEHTGKLSVQLQTPGQMDDS